MHAMTYATHGWSPQLHALQQMPAAACLRLAGVHQQHLVAGCPHVQSCCRAQAARACSLVAAPAMARCIAACHVPCELHALADMLSSTAACLLPAAACSYCIHYAAALVASSADEMLEAGRDVAKHGFCFC